MRPEPLLPPLIVTALGRVHEITPTLLRAELQRREGIPRPPLLEAVIRHAPRAAAIARLTAIVLQAVPVAPGREHAQMHAALGLIYLQVSAAESAPSLAALESFAVALGGSAGATLRAGVLLLRDGDGPAELRRAAAADALLLRQASRAVSALGRPAPLLAGLAPLCADWLAALRRDQKTLGTHALRSFLGDVCEALYRLVQRGGAGADPMLSPEDRSFLQDLVTSELPGTADYLAARPMVWWLGLAAAGGPPDDAAAAAIERARDRFHSEVFHEECSAILTGQAWPPATS